MKALKTSHKIVLGFAGAMGVAALGTAVAVTAQARIVDAVDRLGRELVSAQALAEERRGYDVVMRGVNGLMVTQIPLDIREQTYKRTEEGVRFIDAAAQRWRELPHAPAVTALHEQSATAGERWRAAVRTMVETCRSRDRLVIAGKSADGPELLAAADEVFRAWDEIRKTVVPAQQPLDGVTEASAREVEAARAAASAAEEWARRWLITIAAVACVAMMAFCAALVRSVGAMLRRLAAEARRLEAAVAAGELTVRADVTAVHPELRPVLEGMNSVADAYATPVRVTAEYVDRIGRGDLPPPITGEYRGEFGRIKESLNGCIGAISGLIGEMNRVSAEHDRGEIDAVVEAGRFHGAYRSMAEGVNGMVAGHIAVKKKAMACVAEFGKGNFEAPLERFPGKKAFINETIEQVRSNLKALIADAVALSRSAVEGQLDHRADATKHEGDFRKIIQGVNEALDAIVTPFKVVASYCERLSHGDIPPRRTGAVRGDIVAMQQSVNRCIDSISALVADTDELVKAAVAGQLSVRAEAGRHHGDFRRIVEGVNGTLDAVMGPIEEASRVLERLAERDLRARVKGAYQGDHARIKDALNGTAEALHEAMAQVAEAVSQVSSAAGQIAASSQAVADGASEQASSLEETSSSLESMATMTKQAADSAQQANGLARTAKAAAVEGGAAMEQMTAAMSKIKASSEGTSQIIKDINEIAFQTNLLALNAAVEAARAGEAGRGFAVVAEEVRSLALRSKEAATKTEELIRQSVKEAGEGEVTARHVNEKLGEIGVAVGKVTDIVAEITASAREQATGIEQVNKAVGQMDQVTQQNAASSEESSSAAAELSGQSEELAAMVGSFQLERGPSRPAAPVVQKAARPVAQKAARARGNGSTGLAQRPVRPEQVIPLDGDVAFKEF